MRTSALTGARTGARTGLALAALLAVLATGCDDTTTDAAQATDPARTTTPSTSVVPAEATSAPVPASGPAIPDDFPIAAGLPDTNGDGSPLQGSRQPELGSIELCGETAWSVDDPAAVDTLGVSYVGEAEDSRARLLARYDDADTARAASAALRGAFAACPAGSVGGTDQVYEEVESTDDAATFTHRYRTDGRFDTGLEVIEVVTVGDALYTSVYYGEGGGSDESIASMIAFAHESSAPVVEAMADLDGSGAADGSTTFPLTAGWPEPLGEPGYAGLEYPVDELSVSLPDHACGGPTPAAGTTEVLRAQLTDVESYRSRELLTFADADAAVAHVAALRAFYADCPLQGDEATTLPLRTVDTQVGGESFAVVLSTEVAGEPAIGTSALQVVRVGRGVLLDTTGGEGFVANDADARAVTDEMAEQSGDVVAAMCVLTEAGC